MFVIEHEEVDAPPENWKPIEEFDGYEVSDYGRVRNPKGKIVIGSIGESGHRRVAIRKDGRTYNRHVNRLVAFAFVPNPEGKNLVCHVDGHLDNNHAKNLFWKSTKERHNEESWVKNLSNKRKGAKFSLETKKKMSLSHKKPVTNGIDEFESISIASEFTGVSYSSISNCLTGRSKRAGGYEWNYIKKES